jgi:hypothetical protein
MFYRNIRDGIFSPDKNIDDPYDTVCELVEHFRYFVVVVICIACFFFLTKTIHSQTKTSEKTVTITQESRYIRIQESRCIRSDNRLEPIIDRNYERDQTQKTCQKTKETACGF